MSSLKSSKLYRTLKTTWRFPIIVLLKGGWRMGKTSTALLMAWLSFKWGLIDKIGGNIWTYNDPRIAYVTSLDRFKRWLHADKSRKLFLFDEGMKHAYRRTAMSRKNIGIVQILPELSKGHGRMIFISQTESVDSDILNPVFTRSLWEKKSQKVMVCLSKHHPPRTFENIPDSPIRFDPDRLAPFVDTIVSKKAKFEGGSEIYEVARLYAKNGTLKTIGKELDLHQETVKRDIRKALARFLEYEDAKRQERIDSGEDTETVTSPKYP